MTGHVILGDVTQSMTKSFHFSNSWLFSLSARLLLYMSSCHLKNLGDKKMFVFTSLVWKIVSGC